MFEKARLKLTALYLALTLLISGTLSFLLYTRISSVLDVQFARIETRIQSQQEALIPRGPRPQFQIEEKDVKEAKFQIVQQLLYINGIIALVFGVGGYFLSGKTLEPIRLAMDEQKRFVSDAAHELRTPITALKTSLEVNLMDKRLTQKTTQILKENLEDLKSLESLTEALLVLSRGKSQVSKKSSVPLQKILEKSLKTAKPLAKSKKITIKKPKISKNIKVYGDEETLVQLFLIFLDNAIKYSPNKSKVSLSTKTSRRNVEIEIKDEGVGISRHHLPYIFDRFYRVDQARSKKHTNGHGLGLSIAKKILDDHEGSVDVKSEPEKGTTFIIKLPRCA